MPAAKVRLLADAVHEALVATCDIPANERFQLVSRYAKPDMLIDPTFPDMNRSVGASIVEIILLAGRSDEKKRALYFAIVKGAVAGGFHPDDVMVTLIENKSIDWSLGRGEAFAKPA
jgi:hypothetical protein